MMKKFMMSMLLIILSGSAFAQSSVWKVSSGDSSLYLGGTIHVLRESDYPLPDEYNNAYSHSGTIIFETDIGILDDPDIAQKIMADGLYSDGNSLKTILDPSVYRKLKDTLAEYQIPIESVKYFKPGMLVSTLNALSYGNTEAVTGGVDFYFYSKSLADKKKMKYLETVDVQIKALMNMGIGDENEFILYSLQDLDKNEENLSLLIDEWRHGENTFMEESLHELEADFRGTYVNMVVKRNELWMKKIRKYIQTDEVEFLLFGTLHLHGRDGLLRQLRDEGFTIEQVILQQ